MSSNKDILDLIDILEQEDYLSFKESMNAKIDSVIEEQAWLEFNKIEYSLKTRQHKRKEKL